MLSLTCSISSIIYCQSHIFTLDDFLSLCVNLERDFYGVIETCMPNRRHSRVALDGSVNLSELQIRPRTPHTIVLDIRSMRIQVYLQLIVMANLSAALHVGGWLLEDSSEGCSFIVL